MSQLINIFLEPAKVFAELKERPTFLLPSLLVLLCTLGALAAYFFTVDAEWFVQHQITMAQLANPELPKSQLEAGRQFMAPVFVGTVGLIIGGITMVIVYALTALYYLLAGKVSGTPVGFRQGLALAAWSSMPMLISALLIFVGVFTSSAQTPLEDMQLLNVHPLLVQLPIDSPWAGIARSFSLLSLWCWFLAAMGWKTWSRGGWGGAIFVATLPALLFYGIWALIAAL